MVKKLILLGFGLVLLVGLPLVLFLLQQQTQPTTKAAAVTTFSFDGPTSVTTGQTFSLNLNVDPGGQNQVSFIKFTFSYDSSKLTPGSSFIAIDSATYTVLASPNATCNGTQCTISRTISIGTNQNAIIKSKTTIAVVNFVAQAATDTSPTQLTFIDGQNQALSVGSADQPAENVFQSGTPFSITISGTGGTTGGGGTTPTPTAAPTGTDQGTTGGTTDGTTGGGTTGGTTNAAVSVDCSSFTAQPASGNSPLSTTFTTVASSPNDTISQLVVNYGDGTSDTVASGSGLGTGTINNQITHTYNSNGTFTAFATVTTAGGAINPSNTCRATVTVGAAAQTIAASGKLPSTGPGETILAVGAGGVILSILGGLIFLGL